MNKMSESFDSRPVGKTHGREHLLGSGLSAIVSIHDVMPETLREVVEILRLLDGLNVGAVTMLIVPGVSWPERATKTLASLQRDGHELAGHGWTHAAVDRRTLFHRVHSKIISRDAAEHLSQALAVKVRTISMCHRWFLNMGLRAPTLYVPPAWAMGRIPRAALRELPFKRYEYLTGLYDAQADKFYRLPLVGFEAEPRSRARPLRAWNAANTAWARWQRRPLRIAIHPTDPRGPLGLDLKRLLRSCEQFADYTAATVGRSGDRH